jgi:hypothetical protein
MLNTTDFLFIKNDENISFKVYLWAVFILYKYPEHPFINLLFVCSLFINTVNYLRLYSSEVLDCQW